MRFNVDGHNDGGATRVVEPDTVIVAGYTGRDRAAVQHHIAELAKIGVPPPDSFPAYWLLPPWLATADPVIVVAGAQTSGEAELCLVADGDAMFVSLASDHTDRAAEAIDIELSKAICPIPVATDAWPLADVEDHWDQLVLRSWIIEDGAEVPYQDGGCASLVPPLDLLAGFPFARPERFLMLTGTVGVIGTIRPSGRFRAELHDPVRDRSIELAYDIQTLAAMKVGSPPTTAEQEL